MRTITATDMFCGCGGTSRGLMRAAKVRQLKIDLLAINHWRTAVNTHEMNHPEAQHMCADVGGVHPLDARPNGSLVLAASPECTNISNAKSGKLNPQSRASCWHVVHWASHLRPVEILVENVPPFVNLGPLLDTPLVWKGNRYKEGRPDPRRKGDEFKAFVGALEAIGYRVEWKILNCADYGDPTQRRRLFLRATRQKEIHWPAAEFVGNWRSARNHVIDWSNPSRSIFGRKRALKPKTMARIEEGLRMFGGEAFIAVLRGTQDTQRGSWAKSVDEPIGTISAGGIHAALVQPQPFLIPMENGGTRMRSVDETVPTITTARGGAIALCQPVSFLLNTAHEGGARVYSVDSATPCFPAGHRGELALCQPVEFLTKYYGTAKGAQSVDLPVDTITSKGRLALVQTKGRDILFRMLAPEELARAMGFDEYKFTGTKTDIVKQIGNAVPVNTAAALCGSMLDAVV